MGYVTYKKALRQKKANPGTEIATNKYGSYIYMKDKKDADRIVKDYIDKYGKCY